MTLPVTQPIARQSYENLQNLGVNAISYAKQVQTAIGQGSVPSALLLNLLSASLATIACAQTIQANTTLAPAVVAYVQQQNNAPTLDVATALTASMTALGALAQAIIAEFPKDAAGHLLDRTFDASGNVVPGSLAASALPNTTAAIPAWLATIA